MSNPWTRERREARRLRRIEADREKIRRRLKDALWRWEKWSFANSPSEDDDDQANIHRLIRDYERLGGDALDVVGRLWRHGYLLVEALPEVFASEMEGNYRVVFRVPPPPQETLVNEPPDPWHLDLGDRA